MSANSLSVGEAAEYLRLPRETLYKYVRQGRIPAQKADGRWRFDRDAIDRWVRDHSNIKLPPVRILVVDDEPAIRDVFSKLLERGGFPASTAADGVEAVEMFRQKRFDLVFLDLKMPRMNGALTLRELKTLDSEVEVVIVTAFYDGELMDQALEVGPVSVLRKPVDQKTLLSVARASQKRLGRAAARARSTAGA